MPATQRTFSNLPSDLISNIGMQGLNNTQPLLTQRKLSDIRNEILNQLPSQMVPPRNCGGSCASQVNKNLLEYFVQSELMKLQQQSQNIQQQLVQNLQLPSENQLKHEFSANIHIPQYLEGGLPNE